MGKEGNELSREIPFKNLTVGELINQLEKLPEDYEVVIYNTQMEMRERAVTLEIFEEEEVVEIY